MLYWVNHTPNSVLHNLGDDAVLCLKKEKRKKKKKMLPNKIQENLF